MTAPRHDDEATAHRDEAHGHWPDDKPQRAENGTRNDHVDETSKHLGIAAEHKAASTALRDAELRACRGLAASDREPSPLYRGDQIARVERIEKLSLRGRKLCGARVVLRAERGLTAEWLQRLVDCHVARVAAIGDTAAPRYCPLSVKGVTARVESVGNGFAVNVEAPDEEAAELVLGRARALASEVRQRLPRDEDVGGFP